MKKKTSTTLLFLALFPLGMIISTSIQPSQSLYYYFTFALRYAVFFLTLYKWGSLSAWAARKWLIYLKNKTINQADLARFIENKKWWLASIMLSYEIFIQVLYFLRVF